MWPQNISHADSKTVTVCGCGTQGHISVRALSKVLPIERVFGFDTDRARAESLMNALPAELGIKLDFSDDLENALKQSDVCVTCTTGCSYCWRERAQMIYDGERLQDKLL